MKRKKNNNYLVRIPCINEGISWEADEKGIVTLCIENKGIMKRLTQLLLSKPRRSYIHLDEKGSLVWSRIDGKRDILSIVENVKAEDDVELHYHQAAKYFSILHSYGFIKYK